MKILITGNMGYVGSVLVPYLRMKYPDAVLIGLDIGYFAHSIVNKGPAPEVFLSQQLFQDIRNIDSSILDGVDVVIHLAAISLDMQRYHE